MSRAAALADAGDERTVYFTLFVAVAAVYGGFALLALGGEPFTISYLAMNYAGGFVRRGLLGELLRLASPTVPPLPTVIVGFFLLYLGAAALLARLLMKSGVSPRLGVLIYLSPIGFLFPLNDSAVFMRADIVAIFLILAHATRSIPGGWLAGLLTVSALIHELQLFFLAFHAVLLIDRRERLWPLIPPLAAAVLAGLHPGTPATVNAACAVWRDFPCPTYIAGSLRWGVQNAWRQWRDAGVDYLLAAAIAFAPLVFLWRDMPAARRRQTVAAALAVVPLFAIAIDWGRWLQLLFIHLAAVVAALAVRRASATPRVPALVLAAFGIVYLLGWRVDHFGPNSLHAGMVYECLISCRRDGTAYWLSMLIAAVPAVLLVAAFARQRRHAPGAPT